jgi:hypothetical protein
LGDMSSSRKRLLLIRARGDAAAAR